LLDRKQDCKEGDYDCLFFECLNKYRMLFIKQNPRSTGQNRITRKRWSLQHFYSKWASLQQNGGRHCWV